MVFDVRAYCGNGVSLPLAIAEFAIKSGSDEFAAMAKQALGAEK